jgi:hypothetical protein
MNKEIAYMEMKFAMEVAIKEIAELCHPTMFMIHPNAYGSIRQREKSANVIKRLRRLKRTEP